MADYPASLPTFTNPASGDPANDGSATDATVVVAKIHGELGAALTELGVTPSGASATVAARLDALDTTVSGKAESSTLAETIRDTVASALVAGTNMVITVNDAADTITFDASGGGGLTQEQTEDIVNGLLVAGSNITLTYNDASNTLTVAVSGLTSAQVSDFAEAARDTLGTALTAGTGITITPNDGADTITVATSAILPTVVDAKGDLIVGTAADTVSRLAVGTNNYVLTADSAEATGVKWAAASGSGYATIKDEGTSLTARSTVDFIGVGVTAVDDSGNSKTKVTIPGVAVRDASAAHYWPMMSGDIPSGSTHERAYFVPFIGNGITMTSIKTYCDVGGTSGVIRYGIYSITGTQLDLITDFGTGTATSSGMKSKSSLSQVLTLGTTYYLCVVSQVASAIRLRCAYMSTPTQGFLGSAIPVPWAAYYQDAVTGALPSQAFLSIDTTATGTAPIIQVYGS